MLTRPGIWTAFHKDGHLTWEWSRSYYQVKDVSSKPRDNRKWERRQHSLRNRTSRGFKQRRPGRAEGEEALTPCTMSRLLAVPSLPQLLEELLKSKGHVSLPGIPTTELGTARTNKTSAGTLCRALRLREVDRAAQDLKAGRGRTVTRTHTYRSSTVSFLTWCKATPRVFP